jgi:cell fate regulator YaaT (PSP1 superfamily)
MYLYVFGRMRMAAIIGVRFQKLGKIYHFDAGQHAETLHPGDYVLVTTSRGRQLGQLVAFVKEQLPDSGDHRMIDRPASAQDLILMQTWKEREKEAFDFVQERIQALRVREARVTAVEFGLDGAHMTVLYATETDEKVDMKPLRNELVRRFPHQQIELRQIGPRDVARHLCGFGSCGLENRCCSRFLCEFSPISIKMAKMQGISLNPGEITGMCGRLRCCLIYEYEQYADARQRLPKRGKRVQTPRGPGRVMDVFPLRDGVLVDFGEELGRAEFRLEEIQLLDESGQNEPPNTDQRDREITSAPANTEDGIAKPLEP